MSSEGEEGGKISLERSPRGYGRNSSALKNSKGRNVRHKEQEGDSEMVRDHLIVHPCAYLAGTYTWGQPCVNYFLEMGNKYAFVLVNSSPIPSMYDNHRHPAAGWLTRWLECNRLLPSTMLQKLTLASGMSPSTQRASSSQRSESSNNQLQSPLYLWISLKEHPFLKHTHTQTHTISEGKDPNLEGQLSRKRPQGAELENV